MCLQTHFLKVGFLKSVVGYGEGSADNDRLQHTEGLASKWTKSYGKHILGCMQKACCISYGRSRVGTPEVGRATTQNPIQFALRRFSDSPILIG
jgi:hypothetical protein